MQIEASLVCDDNAHKLYARAHTLTMGSAAHS